MSRKFRSPSKQLSELSCAFHYFSKKFRINSNCSIVVTPKTNLWSFWWFFSHSLDLMINKNMIFGAQTENNMKENHKQINRKKNYFMREQQQQQWKKEAEKRRTRTEYRARKKKNSKVWIWDIGSVRVLCLISRAGKKGIHKIYFFKEISLSSKTRIFSSSGLTWNHFVVYVTERLHVDPQKSAHDPPLIAQDQQIDLHSMPFFSLLNFVFRHTGNFF